MLQIIFYKFDLIQNPDSSGFVRRTNTLLVSVFFFLSFSAFAKTSRVDSLELHNGQKIKLEKVNRIEDRVTSGVLAEDSKIDFEHNSFFAPKESLIYFYPKQERSLRVSLIIIKKHLEPISWVKGSKSYKLNCGAGPKSAGFIYFSEKQKLLGPCFTAEKIKINSKLYALNGSHIEFNKDNRIVYSSLSQGSIEIEKQEVKIEDESAIRKYSNDTLYYFTPKVGEVFSTTKHPGILFSQSTSTSKSFTTIFHPNGYVYSGWMGKGKVEVPVRFINQSFAIQIHDGPIGFNEDGRINKLVNSEKIILESARPYRLERISLDQNSKQFRVVKANEKLILPKGSQIFLEYEAQEDSVDADADEQPRLNNYISPLPVNGTLYNYFIKEIEPAEPKPKSPLVLGQADPIPKK